MSKNYHWKYSPKTFFVCSHHMTNYLNSNEAILVFLVLGDETFSNLTQPNLWKWGIKLGES